MIDVLLSCIPEAHNPHMVVGAAVVCTIGAAVSMRLATRVRRSQGMRRLHWLFIAGVTGGSCVWSTHFVAMLGFDPPFEQGYDPLLTLLSLVAAIIGVTLSFAIATSKQKSWLIEAGGASLGLSVGATHYIGMAGFLVPGHLAWRYDLVIASVLLGAVFGAIAFNRISRPMTRYCRYGGVLAFILAICLLHFTAMEAVTILPDPTVLVPPGSVDETLLAIGVSAMMLVTVGSGLSTYIIDSKNQAEAVEHYRHMAQHDPLTGLANRTLLKRKLAGMINRHVDDTALIGVCTINLDRFKAINDVHGHAAGDHVAEDQVAERMLTHEPASKASCVARLGGDEFVAVVPSIYSRREDALDLARTGCAPPSPRQTIMLDHDAEVS